MSTDDLEWNHDGGYVNCDTACVAFDDAAGRYRLEAFEFVEDGAVADHLGLRAIRIGS